MRRTGEQVHKTTGTPRESEVEEAGMFQCLNGRYCWNEWALSGVLWFCAISGQVQSLESNQSGLDDGLTP